MYMYAFVHSYYTKIEKHNLDEWPVYNPETIITLVMCEGLYNLVLLPLVRLNFVWCNNHSHVSAWGNVWPYINSCCTLQRLLLLTELNAMAALQDTKVYKEGVLQKRQRGLHHKTDNLQFQKRFLKLTFEGLEYYKDNKVANQPLDSRFTMA